MNNQDTINTSIVIEDLAADNADEIKGGPSTQSKRIVVLKSDVVSEESAAFNHNETTVEDDVTSNDLNDLTVSNDDVVKGGPLKRIRIGGMSFGEDGVE